VSADNWASCPRCFREACGVKAAAEKRLAAQYGVVSLDAWDKMRMEVPPEPQPEDFRTFREDYEISGASEWVVRVSYSGRCNACGLRLDFAEDHLVEEHPIAGAS
jgi:hypothetical protein